MSYKHMTRKVRDVKRGHTRMTYIYIYAFVTTDNGS